VPDQVVELADGSLATPSLKRFFGRHRASCGFEGSYLGAVR
jgi:hypothetical protein